MFVYYLVLILYVPWFSKKVIDSMQSIPEGGYMELIAEQMISVFIFMVAVPLIWNAIDSKTETTIDEMNSSVTTTTTTTTTTITTTIDDPSAKPDSEKKES